MLPSLMTVCNGKTEMRASVSSTRDKMLRYIAHLSDDSVQWQNRDNMLLYVAHLSDDGVHGVNKGQPEDGGRVWVEADVEDVAVPVVAAELGHQAVHHQVPVREGGDTGHQAGRVVQEWSRGREQEALHAWTWGYKGHVYMHGHGGDLHACTCKDRSMYMHVHVHMGSKVRSICMYMYVGV